MISTKIIIVKVRIAVTIKMISLTDYHFCNISVISILKFRFETR